MRKSRWIIAAAVLLATLGAVAVASAGRGQLDSAVPATARFHDLDKALEAGYTFRLPDNTGATCIAQPGSGAMGVHMVNTSLLDETLDPMEPEALVYEPRNDGTLKLVALEYVIFEGDWTGPGTPSLFGQPFDYVPAGNRYDLPPFYALHAWLWKSNPSGLFYAWNPRVDCG
jgi:hypothetical protein